MKNKRAQLGKLITSIPLMIFIFIIMGLFIFVSSSFSLAKGGKENPNFVFNSIAQEDLMSKQVTVSLGANKGTEDMLVVDAIARYEKSEITQDSLCESLKPLIPKGAKEPKEPKILFIYAEKTEPFAEKIGHYKPTCAVSLVDDNYYMELLDLHTVGVAAYRNANVARLTSFDAGGIKYYVNYYYGGML